MPEHHPDPDDVDYEDEGPTAEEMALIRSATPDQAGAVDHLLLTACTERWRKVAMVVGASLDEYDRQFPDIPYVYMQFRLLSLVERGVLEAQGDVMAMRHSEVRLAKAASAA